MCWESTNVVLFKVLFPIGDVVRSICTLCGSVYKISKKVLVCVVILLDLFSCPTMHCVSSDVDFEADGSFCR